MEHVTFYWPVSRWNIIFHNLKSADLLSKNHFMIFYCFRYDSDFLGLLWSSSCPGYLKAYLRSLHNSHSINCQALGPPSRPCEILANCWITLQKVERGPWDRVCNGLIHPPPPPPYNLFWAKKILLWLGRGQQRGKWWSGEGLVNLRWLSFNMVSVHQTFLQW